MSTGSRFYRDVPTKDGGPEWLWCFQCRTLTIHKTREVSSRPSMAMAMVRTTCQACLSDCPLSHVKTPEAIKQVTAYRERYGDPELTLARKGADPR